MEGLIKKFKEILANERKPLDSLCEELQREFVVYSAVVSRAGASSVMPFDSPVNAKGVYTEFRLLNRILIRGSILEEIIDFCDKSDLKLVINECPVIGLSSIGEIWLDPREVSSKFDVKIRDTENLSKCIEWVVHHDDLTNKNALINITRFHRIYKGLEALCKTSSIYKEQLAKIIASLDVQKVKPPFVELGFYLYYLSISGLDDEDICKLLGKIVVDKAKYLKENPKDESNDRDFVMRLYEFYNEDGSLKENIDFHVFFRTLCESILILDSLFVLFNLFLDLVDVTKGNFDKNKDRMSAKDFCIKIGECYSRMLGDKTDDKGYTPDLTVDLSNVNDGGISPEARQSLDYIKQYYSNGELKSLPDNLDEFSKNLSRAPFDEHERQSIRRLVEDKLAELNQLKLFEPLSAEQKQIFENGSRVLDSLSKGHKDYCWLSELLSECRAALELRMELDSSSEQDEVLKEVFSLLSQINDICNSLVDEKQETTNRYIFLLDRRGTPYVCSDNEEMDSVYKDRIVDLLKKIAPECEGRFNPVLGVNDANYKMYEVSSSKCHLAFVEVVTGIYVIIGSGVSDKAYDTFNARFRNHLKEIAAFAAGIKDPNLRDKILTDHASYYDLFMGDKTRGDDGHKMSRKPSNKQGAGNS